MNDQNKIQNLSLLISRGFAFSIDNLIAFIIVLVIYHRITSTIVSIPLLVFICVMIYEFYFLLFEIFFRRTPGKFFLGLKVVFQSNELSNENYFSRIFKSFYEILIRNLTRVLIFTPPLFFWNELLIIIFTKGRTIRELITSTSVEFSKKSIIQSFEKDFVINQESFRG
jgi:uncharacterized RDD family membrane protein YckC